MTQRRDAAAIGSDDAARCYASRYLTRPEHQDLWRTQRTRVYPSVFLSLFLFPICSKVQTGFGRGEMPSTPAVFVLTVSLVPAVLRSPPPHSLSHTVKRSWSASRSSRASRSSYSSRSLSRRKIYVNRHVDTCSNVAGARARAERRARRVRTGELGSGSRVTGMQCRISPCPRREKGHCARKETRTNSRICARTYTYKWTRVYTQRTHIQLADCLMNQNYSRQERADRDRRRVDIRVCLQ